MILDSYKNSNFDEVFENSEARLGLSEVSVKDVKWDFIRGETVNLTDNLRKTELEAYANQMGKCSLYLHMKSDAEKKFKLVSTQFCHFRHCPVCQSRKAWVLSRRIKESWDLIKNNYPTHHLLFLTLTAPNPKIQDLRNSLQAMNKAWNRFVGRKWFKELVVGFIRFTEVTRDYKRSNTHAHPHFHVMLLVKPSYFGKNYVKQAEWQAYWERAMRSDVSLIVDIRKVKPNPKYTQKTSVNAQNGAKNAHFGDKYDISGAVAELCKYANKSNNLLGNDRQGFESTENGVNIVRREVLDWTVEYIKQVKGLKFQSSGGVFENALKAPEDIDDKEMIFGGETEDDNVQDDRRVVFSYIRLDRRYLHTSSYFVERE